MAAISLSEAQKSKIMSFLRTCSGIYVGNEAKTLRFIEVIVWIVRTGAQRVSIHQIHHRSTWRGRGSTACSCRAWGMNNLLLRSGVAAKLPQGLMLRRSQSYDPPPDDRTVG
ncbi:MAG: hypothetical protein L6R45_04400 [Anaerolineae bacterium]|nr:hypothetical protein [Anaerolineae bacterium]